MDQNFARIFKDSKYILIMSEITEQPYVDKNGACFFMDSAAEADQFVKAREFTKKGELKEYQNISSFLDTLYLKGIKKLNIKLKDRDSYITYEIKDEDLRKNRYCNHEACFNLLRLHETKDSKYLNKLMDCTFITPISIPVREPKKYPEIKYCVLKRGGNRYNLIFTTLQEYNKWAETQITQYYPLEVNFLKANRIRKSNGIFINPLSTKMILEAETIDELGKGKKK